ncbi:MAG: DAK2 domain-containing protein [Lachnospiraceae bacterium]|nr:DAK2 domain-containing protein [Lachnospiraceae bacterium]
MLEYIDAALLKKMFLSGAAGIEAKKEIINELNVFPVPDGDTGTNMTLTIMSAAKEVAAIEEPTMEQLSKAISSGSLRGARGNSGVILSQLFRGFTKGIRDYEKIDVTISANAFAKAVETAYKAVMKPKEGTILTVARGGAERAAELVGETKDFEVFAVEIIKKMEEVLEYTPELLPVLKEAGVVDSGGQGLLEVIKSAADAMLGKELSLDLTSGAAKPSGESTGAKGIDQISTADIKFGYCTEFIINLDRPFSKKEEADFKAFLESIGDSVVMVADEEICKIHVHTNHPGKAFEKGLTYGSLTRMKVDNMREEHNERLLKEMKAEGATEEKKKPQGPRKKEGFIAVCVGDGLGKIFEGLGVDEIISGGQTMNPSAEDMVNAIDNVNADVIYILPNNSNIILTADQASHLVKDKKIVVVPSKTVPQGISAMIGFVAGKSPEENLELMKESMQQVKTGQVTYSVRDTKIDGKDIKQGDYRGIDDKTIKSVGTDMGEVTKELICAMVDDDSELISIYYGEEVTEDDANSIADYLGEKFPLIDVEIHPGDQPVYYFIVSVE